MGAQLEFNANHLSEKRVFKTQVAVIGAGAAGITLAREFVGTNVPVLLLEAGDYEYDQKSQAVYEAESVTTNTESVLDSTYPGWSRLRYFGGSTGHWGGWSCPLEETDFIKKDWVEHSGWPFRRREILRYYDKACELIEIPRFNFNNLSQSELFLPSEDYDQLFAETQLDSKLEQRYFSYSPPTRFGEKYRDELHQSSNVTVAINANVIRLDMDPFHERIEKVICKNQNGVTFEVHAQVFVLACGGLENPRLLLNSNHQASAGLCNQNDVVGRYFLEHPHSEFAVLMNLKGTDWLKSFTALGPGQSKRIFVTSPEFQRKNKTMSYSCEIMADGEEPSNSKTIQQMKALVSDSTQAAKYSILNVRADMEPNPQNRVYLGTQKDELGLHRIKMNVNFSQKDLDSIRISTEAVMAHLSFLGVGRSQLKMLEENLWPGSVWIGCHHMGTTRMSTNPKEGVVDAHGRAHGLDNLYIAGSSVFPTGGYGNPTLTIVALALRLGDHLKMRF